MNINNPYQKMIRGILKARTIPDIIYTSHTSPMLKSPLVPKTNPRGVNLSLLVIGPMRGRFNTTNLTALTFCRLSKWLLHVKSEVILHTFFKKFHHTKKAPIGTFLVFFLNNGYTIHCTLKSKFCTSKVYMLRLLGM